MKEIRYNKVKINKPRAIAVHPIGDTHIGHKNCDLDRLIRYLDSLKEDSFQRIILMGDLLDCGTKNSIGASAYEQSMSPNEQLTTIVELFRPFAEKGQIDGCLMGNHEYRIMKESGIDILEQFCNQLKIPYLMYSGIITYSIGKRAYNINAFHGKAGGGVENALRACKAMSNKVVADVYLMGHCHHNAYTQRIIKYVDSRNEKLVEQKQHFVLTGHMMKYEDSYADQANLEISPAGFSTIFLSGSRKKEVMVL